MKATLFNIPDLALLITIYQCLLFALFLLSSGKEQKKQNTILALFLLSYAAIPADILITYGAEFRSLAIETSPWLFRSFRAGYWLEGPLLFFYVRAMTNPGARFRRLDWMFLAPFACYITYEFFHFHILSHSEKIIFLLNPPEFKTAYIELALFFLREAFRITCGVLCLIYLHNYSTKIKNHYSNIEKINLNWLTILVVGFFIIRLFSLFIFFSVIAAIFFGVSITPELFGFTTNFLTMFLISGLIFFSLRFKGIEVKAESLTKNGNNKENIKQSDIDAINTAMKELKPYLNSGLTLDMLSEQIRLPARHLSNIINRHFECNFFEFVNNYRIEESQRLLSDATNRNLNVLELMELSGFNSKATFNTYFKKKVGMTPTQYRKKFASTTAA